MYSAKATLSDNFTNGIKFKILEIFLWDILISVVIFIFGEFIDLIFLVVNET